MAYSGRCKRLLKFAICVASYDQACCLLLSSIPTPSIVIDCQALEKIIGPMYALKKIAISLPGKATLFPLISGQNKIDHEAIIVEPDMIKEEGVTFIHTSVVRGRKGVVESAATFIAEVDLPRYMAGSKGARPCLGLNNHHVGGYYWARSAGSGAAMEVPGVIYDEIQGDGKGNMLWNSDKGPFECNSNDGKRSEWVDFLKIGDNVNLIPFDAEECIGNFVDKFDSSKEGKPINVFGISFEGRPLGSDPRIIAEWRCCEIQTKGDR